MPERPGLRDGDKQPAVPLLTLPKELMTAVLEHLNAADLAALDCTCRTLHTMARDPHFILHAEHLWQKVLNSWWTDEDDNIRAVVKRSRGVVEPFIFSDTNEAVMLHRASMITQKIIEHSARCFDDNYLLAFDYDQLAVVLLTEWLGKSVAANSPRFVAWQKLVTSFETGKEMTRSFTLLSADHTAVEGRVVVELTAQRSSVSTFLASLCAQHKCKPPEVDATAITRATFAIQNALSGFDMVAEAGEEVLNEWLSAIDIYPRPNGVLSQTQHDAHVANLAAILGSPGLFWMFDTEEPWASESEMDAEVLARVVASEVQPEDAATLRDLLASPAGAILASAYASYEETVENVCEEEAPWRPMEVAISANEVFQSNHLLGSW